MSYGFYAVLTQIPSFDDAVSDPSCVQPPSCEGAPSTR
jgi:hypothetical protein